MADPRELAVRGLYNRMEKVARRNSSPRDSFLFLRGRTLDTFPLHGWAHNNSILLYGIALSLALSCRCDGHPWLNLIGSPWEAG